MSKLAVKTLVPPKIDGEWMVIPGWRQVLGLDPSPVGFWSTDHADLDGTICGKLRHTGSGLPDAGSAGRAEAETFSVRFTHGISMGQHAGTQRYPKSGRCSLGE